MSNIEKLKAVLASSFWGDESTFRTIGPMMLSIINMTDGYHWRIWDKQDNVTQYSNTAAPSLAHAKDSLRQSVEKMLLQESDKV
jgi:hypothetical protein